MINLHVLDLLRLNKVCRFQVNNNEMVALEREPHNKYDRNAIKVVNVVRQQVGHIKRELASALAPIMDSGWVRLEG